MTNHESFQLVTFSIDGTVAGTDTVQTAELDQDAVEYFGEKFLRLSGDLELPMEGKLPGNLSSIEFQISSDKTGAYVLYYIGDLVVFASLMVCGIDELAETELMQVFKFLLLDTEDADEPTEDAINAVLNQTEFDFFATEDRPVSFQIQFPSEPGHRDTVDSVMEMDKNLASAFFKCPRPVADA